MTSDLEFARRIALRLLETRSRSEAELRARLAAKAVPEELIDQLVERFTEVGLIDDAAFARALVRTRSEIDRQGRVRIRMELRRRGVADEIAEAALVDLERDDELSTALVFAERRLRGMGGLAPVVVRRRLHAALARRGFSQGICLTVLASVLGESEEGEGASDGVSCGYRLPDQDS